MSLLLLLRLRFKKESARMYHVRAGIRTNLGGNGAVGLAAAESMKGMGN